MELGGAFQWNVEGTFTPTLYYQNTSGLTLSYDEQVGHYTKIGDIVSSIAQKTHKLAA